MEKQERITFEIDRATKKRFLAFLNKNGQTVSKVLRLKVQQYILLCEEEEKKKGGTAS